MSKTYEGNFYVLKLHMYLSFDPAILHPRSIHPRYIYFHKYLWHCGKNATIALFQEQKDWKHIKYVSFGEWLQKLGYFCTKPRSALAGGFFTTSPPGNPNSRLYAMLVKIQCYTSVYRLGGFSVYFIK